MDAFARVAAWYFANPPATWRLTRRPLSWDVIARDGTYISSHRTRRDAAANLTAGPCAQAYYATVDWYLGYRREPRPLADEERQVIVQVLSSTDSSHRFDGSNSDEMRVRTE